MQYCIFSDLQGMKCEATYEEYRITSSPCSIAPIKLHIRVSSARVRIDGSVSKSWESSCYSSIQALSTE
jgi:hypothetical protein